MKHHIGETLEGIISGITAWGIYVELPNTVEGMIHVARLTGDYYYYKEETFEMVGRDTGRCFKLGQRLKVFVDSVDMVSKSVDFLLAEDDMEEEERG